MNAVDFYELHTPSGTAVTLTGSIRLTKPQNGDWRLEDIKADSITPELDGTIAGSQLQNACRLDDATVKTAIGGVVNDYLQMAEALVKQKDDFTRLCQPGAKFKGKHRSNGVGRDVTIEFESADEDTARGKITSNFFDNNIPRPFTVNLNRMEKVEFPIKGSISLQRGPAESISIRFEGDTMVFKMDADNSTSNLQRTQDVAPNKNAAKPDRKWIAPILEKWIRENAGTIRLAKEAPQNAAPGQFGNPLQNVGVQVNSFDLKEEIRKSGFGDDDSLKEFLVYGSKNLKDKLNACRDEFDRATVRKSIKAVQNEIAQKTFLGEYAITTYVTNVDDDKSRCNIAIETGFDHHQTERKAVSFPWPDVSCNSVSTRLWTAYFSVSGNTSNIQELHRNSSNYRARVQFNNLKMGWSSGDIICADLLKVEIFKVGDRPEGLEMQKAAENNAAQPVNGRASRPRRGP